MTHICISKRTIIGSDSDLPLGRRQAIIWTNAGILLIRNKFQWNLKRNSYIFIQETLFENVVLEISAILPRPQCLMKAGLRLGGGWVMLMNALTNLRYCC